MIKPAETPPPPEPSPMIEAFRVLSQITTAVSIMLILGGLGYLIDVWANITLFSLLGTGLGGFLGIRYLIDHTSS